MNLRHIRIFLTVVNSGNNISEAARRLMISQPSVSLCIQELETEFGVRLFDRLSRRLYLTEAGRRFEQYAKKITASCDDLEREMKGWNDLGILQAGASITAGSRFMPDYAAAYRLRRPDIQLHVLIDHSRNLEKLLLENALDLAVIETPVHDEALSATLFKKDSLEVIVPPDSDTRPVISPKEFIRLPFLLREPGSGIRDVFDRAMNALGHPVEPVWTANSTTALIHAVSRGLGVSVVPRAEAEEAEKNGKIRRIRVRDLEFIQHFYIVRHRDKLLMPYMEDFISCCLEPGAE